MAILGCVIEKPLIETRTFVPMATNENQTSEVAVAPQHVAVDKPLAVEFAFVY